MAVLRHAERQDAIWDSAWHGSEDAKRHPVDCPITDSGVACPSLDTTVNLMDGKDISRVDTGFHVGTILQVLPEILTAHVRFRVALGGID